jgi:hypothetical protein
MRAAFGVTPAAVYELVHVCQARAVRPHINVIATAILCTAATVGTASAHDVCRGTDPRCYHDWAKDKREGNRVLIYTAFGTEYNWPWYEGLLGDTSFYVHGEHRNGTVKIVAPDPSTDALPKTWPFRDEWYNVEPLPTQVKCHYYDGGRAWLTTLGHDHAAFTAGSEFPGQREFEQLLVNGIKSAMGLIPFCTK